MNLRRILLDVDKGLNRPTLTELAGSIEDVPGVDAVKITVTEMDMEYLMQLYILRSAMCMVYSDQNSSQI